jgi:hypothetical protein
MRYLTIITGIVTALALMIVMEARAFEDKAQVTIGGAESVITGYIVKIDNNAYWIRQATGEVNRVRVNEGTHMICPTRPGSTEAKVESRSGRGFRIGDCPFISGDTVKVEVSDLGWASLVRYAGSPTSPTAQLGLPQGWDGDIPHGVLEFKGGPAYPVQTKDGKHVGHLAGTLTDTGLGTSYGLLVRADDYFMIPVPMTYLKQQWPQPNKPRVVLLIAQERFAQIHMPTYSVANRISVPEVRNFWAKVKPPEAVASKEIDVELVIDGKAFQITQGGREGGFDLVAGMPATIRLRNRDNVAHEFVYTLFRDVPFRLSGNATMIKTERASGVRLDPGQHVTLEFVAPLPGVDAFGATESAYDIFYCNIHGKEHGEKMRGEVVIVETRGEIGGG